MKGASSYFVTVLIVNKIPRGFGVSLERIIINIIRTQSLIRQHRRRHKDCPCDPLKHIAVFF